MGAPPEVAAAHQEPEEYEVWPENWSALAVFLACDTQWRWLVAPKKAFRTGLDYSAVRAAMDMMGVKDNADTFARLRVLESTALEILSRE